MMTGLFFGLYLANRAPALRPIDALRVGVTGPGQLEIESRAELSAEESAPVVPCAVPNTAVHSAAAPPESMQDWTTFVRDRSMVLSVDRIE